MLCVTSVLLFVIGGVLASPSANYYVDTILNVPLRNELRYLGLDPAPMSDFSTEFYDKIIIIGKVKGQANYTDGQLTGLTSATRNSECQGPAYSYGMRHINCTIALTNISTHYSAKIKYGKLPKFNIKASGNITRTVIFVDFVDDPSHGVQLRNFQFYEMGQVQPKFTGLGSVLNKYLKVLEDSYKSHVGADVFNMLNQRFQSALNRAAAQVQMPM